MKKIFTLLSVFILTTLFSSCIILADGEYYGGGSGSNSSGKRTVYEGSALSETDIKNCIGNIDPDLDLDTGAYYFNVDLGSSEFYSLKAKLNSNGTLSSNSYTKNELENEIRSISNDYSGFAADVAKYMFSSNYSHYLYAIETKSNGRFIDSYYIFMK